MRKGLVYGSTAVAVVLIIVVVVLFVALA